MRVSNLFLYAPLLIAACAPPSLFFKPGISQSQFQSEQLACKTFAAQQVPPSIQTRYIPPTYAPQRICTGAGNCYYKQVLVSPGRFETYDANLGLRGQVEDQCKIEKGFSQVSVPRCEVEVTSKDLPQPGDILPPISEASCALRTKAAGWQVVTP